MKIRVYIVTYKRNDVLNQNLKSLFNTVKNPKNIEITVLAKHPSVKIEKENNKENLRVVLNTTRMPHAWGNLARDWNFCILDCFKTSDNPDNVDWLVLAQNDVTWIDGWDVWLINNKNFDFVSQPKGDQAIALNIDAINKVGFFDECLTTLHFHEIDYFIRCILYNEERSSINDNHKKYFLSCNEVGNVLTNTTSQGINNKDETLHNKSNWQTSKDYLCKKWNIDYKNLSLDYIKRNREKLIEHHSEINWYPFFWETKNYKQQLFSNFVTTHNFKSDFFNNICRFIYHKETFQNRRIIYCFGIKISYKKK